MNKAKHEIDKIIYNFQREFKEESIQVRSEMFCKTETLAGSRSVPWSILAICDSIKVLTMPIYEMVAKQVYELEYMVKKLTPL